ncbi:MAG: 6-phosphogluconolactonase [Planctomycetota bacterium]
MSSDEAPIETGPIPLEEGPQAPDLPGTVIVGPTADAVIDALAADMLGQAKTCVRQFGDFHLALSGGSTPQPLYRRLMYDPRLRDFPWARTHLWIVDERRVPFDDQRSNFGMIRDLIIEPSGIPASQVHAMPATEADGDELYETELRETLGWREKGHDRLDFALLGMGDDLHTASLFPRSVALEAPEHRLVVINAGDAVTPPERITMTYSLLNASRVLAVLVTGEKKQAAIARLVGQKPSPADAPIAGLKPIGGVLRWYLDPAACPPRQDG